MLPLLLVPAGLGLSSRFCCVASVVAVVGLILTLTLGSSFTVRSILNVLHVIRRISITSATLIAFAFRSPTAALALAPRAASCGLKCFTKFNRLGLGFSR